MTAGVTKPENCLTSDEVARHFGVTSALVTREARAGKIDGAYQVLGQWLFDETVLDTWTPAPLALKDGDAVRDEKGHFLPGNQIARGNKGGRLPRVVEQRYLKKMHEVVDMGEWEAICRKAVTQALEGDRHARKWLTENLIGQPVRRVETKMDVTQNFMSIPEQFQSVMQLLMFVATQKGIDLGNVQSADFSDIVDGMASVHSEDDDLG